MQYAAKLFLTIAAITAALFLLIAVAHAVSPLSNGNFESGNQMPWSLVYFSPTTGGTGDHGQPVGISTTQHEDGSYSYKLSATDYAGTPYGTTIYQDGIDCTGLTSVSFWVYFQDTYPVVEVSFWNNGAWTGKIPVLEPWTTSNFNTWIKYTVTTGLPTSGTHRFSVGVRHNTNFGLTSTVYVDDIRFNNQAPPNPTANVTFRFHEYSGNFSTSPLIAGNVYLNGTRYTVNNTGSTYPINLGYYQVAGSSTGYDNISTTMTVATDNTLDLYFLKQNNCVITYDVIDSITHALVEGAQVEFYDTVTGNRTNYTTSRNNVQVFKNYTIYINGSKAGYNAFSRNYTPQGDTQTSVVLGSQMTAPAGTTFVTFRVTESYLHPISGANIQVDGHTVTTDESGMVTTTVNGTNGSYAWTITANGYYPQSGLYGLNSVMGNTVDVQLVARGSGATPAPGQVDTGIIGSYKGLVNGSVNTVVGGVQAALQVITVPVGVFNSSITSMKTAVARGMGFGGNSTNVYANLFSVIIFGLPWQVKGLITYFLAWQLVLMFLNR